MTGRLGCILVATVLAVSGFTLLAVASGHPRWSDASQLAVIDIDQIGPTRLQALREEPGVAWWVELDSQLLVLAQPEALAAIGRERSVLLLESVDPNRLQFVRQAHSQRLVEAGIAPLASGGRWAVIETPKPPSHGTLALLGGNHAAAGSPTAPQTLAETAPFPRQVHVAYVAFQPNTVLARQAANDPALVRSSHRASASQTEAVASLVAEVDEARWFADLETLASWNRHTRGTQIHDARDWLLGQFSALPGLTATTQSFNVGATPAFNVIATLPGTIRSDDWYLIGAHYDSTSQNTALAAPGAEDNASGCAAVLEMARIFSHHPPEATMIFLCYSGEEQGLFGGSAHASKLVTNGDNSKVRAVLTMDMIGYTGDADLDCLLESNNSNAALIQQFADAAAQHTTLRIVTSFFPFGSDHVPYLNRGMPALLVIENDWDSYPGYHRTTDLPTNITLAMGRETLRMNVATLAPLVGTGGSNEIFSDGFESGDTGQWSAQN